MAINRLEWRGIVKENLYNGLRMRMKGKRRRRKRRKRKRRRIERIIAPLIPNLGTRWRSLYFLGK
jgi:Mn-dependent DtxR family transcriptional regulator